MSKTEYYRQKRRRKNRIFNICLYSVAAILILTGVFIILRDRTMLFNRNTGVEPEATFPPIEDFTPLPSVDPTAVPTGPIETPAPTPTPVPVEGSRPISVSFVDHGISVAVEPVGVNENGEMATIESASIAGWYEYGACPNEVGNCIIAGHNRYGGQLGLFSIVHDGLNVGDRITVQMANGEYVFYRVVSIQNYEYDEVPAFVMAQSSDRRLTLITCLGDYDHSLHMSRTRTVAICTPIE